METNTISMEKTARLDDFDLYCTVRQIGDQIVEIAKKHGCWIIDHRSEKSNPFYNQTANGLFIEHCYGRVNKLWTPWGLWRFIGSSSGNWDAVWKEVADPFGPTLHTSKQINSMDEFWSVFAIIKFGEQQLPSAVVLDQSRYDSYQDVKAAWEKLAARYRSEKQQD
ncbi:MAG: hypothetical protein K8F91_22375 [Candidatus Obscuribacterales bacterium]|nr:hypothetical protein [Candidatus Obscuribacterales bacterium]